MRLGVFERMNRSEIGGDFFGSRFLEEKLARLRWIGRNVRV